MCSYLEGGWKLVHGCEQDMHRGVGEHCVGIEPIVVETIVRSGGCAVVS